MKTKKLVMAALLGALAAILMVLDFNVPFVPMFIKFDFSDFPVLIGGFVFGPLTGVLIAFLKIVLNLLFKPTTTMFVGEASNFLLSVCYMGVACLYYRKHRTKKGAVIGMVLASVDIPNSLAYIGNITNRFDAIANKLVATVASTMPITAPFLVRCFL